MSMVELQEFLALVEDHKAEADFVGPRDETLVDAAEAALGIKFPPTYRRFVSELGAGDIAGQELFGIVGEQFENSSIPNGVWLTLNARGEWQLPKTMMVVYFDGGVDYFVIDTARAGEDGEPPVEVWRPGVSKAGDTLERVASDFGAFAKRIVSDALG